MRNTEADAILYEQGKGRFPQEITLADFLSGIPVPYLN